MIKIFIETTKLSSTVILLCTFPCIWISILWLTKHARLYQQQDGLFYTTVFLIFFWIDISQISKIWKNANLSYQTICDHMFSYPTSDHSFHTFWLSNWLIFCLFSYVENFHLIQRQGGVGIYCRLITNWIELNQARIWFPAQYITKVKILLGEVFLKYHRVFRQQAPLYLDFFIATASIIFSPRVFPRPYNTISQNSSTQNTSWMH